MFEILQEIIVLYMLFIISQICTCQPGYTGEPTHGCQLIDYCSDQPCAPGAVCENSRGSYRCHCQQGMVGDPYNGGCQPPVECLQDGDCPLTAKCINVNNVPKCFGRFMNLKYWKGYFLIIIS